MIFFKRIFLSVSAFTAFAAQAGRFTRAVVDKATIMNMLNEINRNPYKDTDQGNQLRPSERAVYWGFFATPTSDIYLSDLKILADICHEGPFRFMRYLIEHVNRDSVNFARAYEDHLHTVEDFDNAMALFKNNDKAKCESCDALNTFMLQQRELRQKHNILKR